MLNKINFIVNKTL